MTRVYVTRRQAMVLDKLCEGKQDKAIAYDLGLSPETVKVHMRALLAQYGARNRVELALMARGILPVRAA